MDFAHIRALIPYAVLGAGLIVVASSFQPPSATLKRSLGPVTSIAKERSQEAQPVANAEVPQELCSPGVVVRCDIVSRHNEGTTWHLGIATCHGATDHQG